MTPAPDHSNSTFPPKRRALRARRFFILKGDASPLAKNLLPPVKKWEAKSDEGSSRHNHSVKSLLILS